MSVVAQFDAMLAAANTAPVAQDDPNGRAEQGYSTMLDVLANDSDADGDTLQIIAASITGGSGGSVEIYVDPETGRQQLGFDTNDDFDHVGADKTETVEIEYTVSDGNGGTHTATATVVVIGRNDRPEPEDDAMVPAQPGGVVRLDVLANDSDPDGDVLQITNAVISGGMGGTVEVATDEETGQQLLIFDTGDAYDHLGAGETQSVEINYTVYDNHGGWHMATAMVVVTGVSDSPVARDDLPVRAEQNYSAAIDVLANDTDPNGDVLTIISASVVGGAGGTIEIYDDPVTGRQQLGFDTNDDFDYLGADESETVQVSYIVSDGNGGTSTATAAVTVFGRNDRPEPEDDVMVPVEQGRAVRLDVLANDTDIDGDSLTINSFAITTPGAGGTLELGTDEETGQQLLIFDTDDSYDYLGEGETEQVSITYTVYDNHGGWHMAGAMVEVVGVNDAPEAQDDAAISIEQGQSAMLDVLANDTDIDGDGLVITAAEISVGSGGAVEIATDGQTGAQRLIFDTNDDYDHLGVGENEIIEIRYTVDDGHGGTHIATAAVTVIGSNDQPDPRDDLTVQVEQGRAVRLDVLANDSDIDSDTLAITAATITTNDVGGSVQIGTDEETGQQLLFFDTDDYYDHLGVGESQIVEIMYTVSDGHGGSSMATAAVEVTGLNDRPEAQDDTAVAVAQNQVVTLDVLANDVDIDGDALAITAAEISVGPGGAVAIVTDQQTGRPKLVFDTAGAFGHLGAGETEMVEIMYTVDDGHGGTHTATAGVLVSGTNSAPTGITLSSNAVAENAAGAAIGTLGTIDPDAGDSFTYTVSDSRFEVATVGGVATLKLKANTSLDHEVTPTLTLAVTSTDQGGRSIQNSFLLSVTNVAESQTFAMTASSFTAPSDDHWSVAGTSGSDTITTAAGNDTVRGQSGNDIIRTSDGNDSITFAGTAEGFDDVDGGAGTDTIRALAANSVIGIHAIKGIEVITANGLSGVAVAGSGLADLLDFSSVTLTGITRIDAGAGNDSIVGSALADTIVGGAGDDALAGGGGNDVFQVGLDAGRDAYDGGAGTDQITATANNVVIGISSITGIETISGGKFSGVVVAGTDAADLLDFSGVALSAIARIEGGAGTDTLTGSGAADRIYGGSGADAVLGGAGADILRGDAGADTLVGGVGKDQFQYTSVKDSLVGQADVIRDFARGEDKIDLSLIDANLATAKDDAFRLIGNASFSGTAAEVRWAYDQVTNTTQILGNLAGDLTADFEIRLEGNVALDARTDFLG